jgi:outer membrane protein assembly factor BamB
MKRFPVIVFIFSILCMFGCDGVSRRPSLQSGDWPQYRADAGRTGYTPSELPASLSLRWKYTQDAPAPAWKGVHTRMTFDYACQPVIAGKTLYFGSSTDCKIYALNIDTGGERWSFFTGAPVRFAPVLWRDRVFVVSDDGFLYCLSAKKGTVLWKKRGGPDDSMVLGNDRMISRWPVRGGAVIKDDILYFGAGIWPSEGIYIYALNPETGNELWINDEAGGMEYDQPHGGSRAKSGISSQGYIVAAGDNLFIPTGRSVPAALNIEDGTLNYFHLQKHRAYGGSRVMAAGEYLFATSGNTNVEWETIGRSNAIFNTGDGELAASHEFNSPAMAITPDYIFYVNSTDRELKAFNRDNFIIEKAVRDRKGETVMQKILSPPSWTINTNEPEAISMIFAGNKIVSGSINNKVTVMDSDAGTVAWSGAVDGAPYGLAVAHGRLFVSTERGTIYCFDNSASKKPNIIAREPVNSPYGTNEIYAEAAEEIIRQTGITDGYCLDLGCGDGRLAYELAKRTNLNIYAVDANPKNVDSARKAIDRAGIYGKRITVHQGDLSQTPYPKYFANLVVSGRSVTVGGDAVNLDEAYRIQRPNGGVLCVGKPGAMKIVVRDGLDGAGEWTHLYGNPANTINSGDEAVKGPLGMLWFRDSDFEMPSRHGRGVGPLYSAGRLFIQGTHGIRAHDAYNGHILWEYYIEDLMKPYDQEHLLGAATTHGNWCVEEDRLYVRVSQQMAGDTFRNCLVLDVKTGNPVDRFRVPENPKDRSTGYWGYLAIDNGTLFGTVANDQHITKWGYLESNMSSLFSESKAMFALDAKTGEVKWFYNAENSIRHNAIAIGEGRVYLIDRPIASADYLFSGGGRSRGTSDTDISHPAGKLVVLDAETGKVLKVSRDNIFGTLLALSVDHDMLIMTYQYTRFKLPSEIGGRMAGFRASDIEKIWDNRIDIGPGSNYGYTSRPIINGYMIYFEPHAFDISTGEKLDFSMSRYYNCGIITGSKNMMLYRSGTMGYFDLMAPEEGTQDYGGIRPGCWINTIPAGGLVLMPDATARCNCSYLIKSTIALAPM